MTRWLHISGNYTYDDTLVIASPNYYDPTLAPGNRLAKRPLHSATLIANANFHRMNWNLAGYYVGRRTDSDYLGLGITSNPSYVRWDLGTSYHFTRKLSALGRVENLFDRRYQDAVGYPALGLNWRLGMKYVWGGDKSSAADAIIPAFSWRKRPQRERGIAPEVLAKYEAVIGLEVHAQLLTATKAFCACSPRFGDPPNTNTCPVCLGLPGALPVLNRRRSNSRCGRRLRSTAKCRNARGSRARIIFILICRRATRFRCTSCRWRRAAGLKWTWRARRSESASRAFTWKKTRRRICTRASDDSDRYSYIDFNRGGAPLIEIVSEPDLRAPAEAHAYLTALKQILLYTEVSDCNMEEGSLRCDANVRVRLRGAEKFGTKAEVKNLNSFRFLQRALEHEIERQIGVIESGGTIPQETRLYNVRSGPHGADALEGIRARLSLFSGSRFVAGARERETAEARCGPKCRNCRLRGGRDLSRVWADCVRCRRC